MSTARAYIPEVGDHVIVPTCAMLLGVGRVVAFDGARAVIESVASPNVTIALRAKTRIFRERCTEHSDCRACDELAVECAKAARS